MILKHSSSVLRILSEMKTRASRASLTVGILRDLSEFLKKFGRALRALAEIAEHPNEEFLLIFDWHD